MNIILRTLVILLSLVSINLNATQKEAKDISQISASALYNIDKKSLQSTIKSYTKNNPNLKALKIIETLSNETYISIYRNKKGELIEGKLPSKINQYAEYKAISKFEGEKVGEVFAYYENDKLINLTSEEKKWLEQNEITLSVDDSYAPMNFKNFKNEMDGLSIDYIKLIEKKIGYPINLDSTTWPVALDNAMKHKTDGVINANKNKKRAEKLIFTDSYITVPMVLITSENETIYNNLNELKNKTILVREKTIEASILPKKYPSLIIKEVKSYRDAFMFVSTGKADGVFGHMAVLEYEMNKYLLPNIKKNLVSFKDVITNQSIAIRNNAPILRNILNKAILSISAREKTKINNKWMKPIKKVQKSLSSEEITWLKQNPLRIAVVDNYPPYDFRDEENNLIGLHSDITRLINKNLGTDIKIKTFNTWSEAYNSVINGNVNGIYSLSWSKEREEKHFDYSSPYHFSSYHLVVKSNNDTHISLENIGDKIIAVEADTIFKNILEEKAPNANVLFVKDIKEAYESVKNGKAFTTFSPNINDTLFKKSGLKIASEVYHKSSNLHIGTNKKNPIVASILNKGINSVSLKDITGLRKKWFEQKDALIPISDEEKEWIRNNPSIKVIEFFNEPPFTINGQNKKSGYIYELLEEMTRLSGLKIEYINDFDSFDSMVESLGAGTVDIQPTFLSKMPLEKDSTIKKTKTILSTPFVVIGRLDSPPYKTIDDLKGKRVAVVKGYAQDKHLSKVDGVIKVHVKHNDEGFKVLKEGKVDYYINNNANSQYIITKSFSTKIKVLSTLPFDIFPPLEFAIGINGKKPHLASILNKALEEISAKKIQEIRNRWILESHGVKDFVHKINLTEKEKEFIKKHPKIRVHNEKAWAPYNFYEKGRARGLSIDYIKALASKAGLEIEFISGPTWDEFMTMSKNKDIDVILNIVKSPSREKFLNFTNPYSELYQSLYIRKGENPITRTEELFGKTFAVPKGFYYEEKLKEYPDIKLLKLKNTFECIQAVSFGKADAMLDLTAVVNFYKNKHKIENIKMGGTLGWEGGSLPLNIGVRKDWPELVSILNKSLNALSDDEIDNIEDKWLFNNSQSKEKMVDLTKEEKKWIRDNIVKVGIEEWAPVIFSHGGKDFDGITGDVLRLVIEKTGLNIEVINDLWDPLLEKFKRKELDLLPATYYTDERAKYGLYSQGYYKMLDYIYVREDNRDINFMKDLKGKRLAIPKGFGTIPKIKEKFPDIKIVETKDLSDSIHQVLNGSVDALFDGQIAVEYKMQEDLITGLRGIPQKVFNAAPLHFFSNIDKPILKNIINKAIKDIPPYEINKIKSKWILQNLKRKTLLETKSDSEKLTLSKILPIKEILIGIGIFLIVFYLIWKYQVKSTNKDMTLKSTLFVIIGLFLFFASLITILTLQNIEKSQKNEIEESLKTVVNSTYKTIKIWIDAKFRRIDIVLDNEKLINQIINLKDNKDLLSEIDTYFSKYEKVFEDSRYYLVSDKLEVILSSVKDYKLSSFDKDAINKMIDRNSLRTLTVFPSKKGEIKQKNILFIKAIKDKNKKSCSFLVMEVDPTKEFTRILQNGRIGNSGETYTFNDKLQLVSNSRFDKQLRDMGLLEENKNSILNIDIRNRHLKPTFLAQKALEKTSGITSVAYEDYRSVKVYGAWIWDDELEIAFASEIDEKEAMGAFSNMKNTIIIIVFSIISFTIFLTVLTAWISTRSKKSLEKANDDLNKLLESFDANVIASRSDLKGNITYASKAFVEISGYSIEELMGSPHSIVRHPDTPKEVFENLWKTIQSGKIWKGEVKNRRKDGSIYWVDVVITPKLADDGNIISYSAIRQDITSKKEVEELSSGLEIKVEERTKELDKNVTFMNTLIENLPVAVFAKDVKNEFRFITWNRYSEELFGTKAEKIIGKNDFDLFPKEQAEHFLKTDKEVVIKNQVTEIPEEVVSTKNGDRILNTLKIGIPDENGNPNILLGIAIDITEQKKAQQVILQNQEQMTYVSQFAKLGFWNFNPQIGDLYVNDTFVTMLGYVPNEVLIKGYESEMFKPFKDGLAFWKELLHPDDVEHTEKIIQAHINGETDLYKVEYRMKKADGSWMWSLAVGKIAEYDENKNPIRFNGVNIDIQEAKDAQEEISQNKLFVDTLLDSQEQIVITTDGKSLQSCNEAFLKLFQLKNMEEFKKDYDCICDRFIIDETNTYLQKYMGELSWIEHILANENETHKAVIVKDDIEHIFTVTAAILPIGEGVLKSAVFTDITELEIQKKQTESILSSVLLPMLITSKKTRKIVYANSFAESQYETTLSKLIGLDIEELYTEEDQRDIILNELTDKGIVQNLESKYKTLAGNEFDALLSLVEINYGGEDCYLGVASDITEQRNREVIIQKLHKNVTDSIEYASLIQHSLIPNSNEIEKYFDEYFTIWHPKDIVGGDIYLFEELRNENECLLMVIDCTGHGVPGAFVTMLVKAIERQVIGDIMASTEEVSPAKILEYFNVTMKKLLKQESDDSISNAGFDGGILYYNRSENYIKYAGAETPLFYIQNDELNMIKTNRHSIGYKKSDLNYKFDDYKIEIDTETRLYISTDGYFDQTGGIKGFPYSKRRYKESILENYILPFFKQKELLLSKMSDYQKNEDRNDDMTIVGLKLLPNNKKVNNRVSWDI